jgi:hypothetical protein
VVRQNQRLVWRWMRQWEGREEDRRAGQPERVHQGAGGSTLSSSSGSGGAGGAGGAASTAQCASGILYTMGERGEVQ